jgi:hypothetical protein
VRGTGYDARGNTARVLEGKIVTYCHTHNLVDKEQASSDRRFGIRVTLPASDTFAKMLGESWENIHWYRTEEERDLAFDNMATRHGYYRNTDTPTQVLEKIVR